MFPLRGLASILEFLSMIISWACILSEILNEVSHLPKAIAKVYIISENKLLI